LADIIYAIIAFACGISSQPIESVCVASCPHDGCEIALHTKRNRRSLIALTSDFLGIFTAWFCVPFAVGLVVFPMMMDFFADRIFPEQLKKD